MSIKNQIQPTASGPLLTAIGLLSAAIIAFQLALMQVFSIVQWYHFAYMVISVALLGFGAAGTFLSLFQNWLTARYRQVLPALCFLTAAGMALAVGASQLEPVRFDLFLLFSDASHGWRLLVTYLLFFLPFFTGALAIGLTFVMYAGQIGKIYFSNLLGSGTGGVLALVLMGWFLPNEMPALLAVLPLLAGLVILPKKNWKLPLLASLSAVAIAVAMFSPPRLHPSEFKDLSKTLLLPDAEIFTEKSSPYGLMQAVRSPVLRHAPGLSLNYTGPVPMRPVIFNNGNWDGPIVPKPRDGEPMELNYSTAALPYVIRQPASVLIPGAGTGEAVAHALARNAGKVVAVEPNAVLVSLLSDELAAENDSLFHHPSLEVHCLEPRTWLMEDPRRYDLIVLPGVGSFGGSSGVNAIREQFAMTREAFTGMWNHLAPDGLLAVTCWMDYPVRNPLKLLATLAEVLEQKTTGDLTAHIAAVRSWGTITFVVKKSPLTAEEVERIRKFCEEMSFDPAILPGLQPAERQQFNQFQDSLFFKNIDALLSPDRDSLYRSYAFNIRPATDQRPFFSQFLRWKNLPQLAEWTGSQSVPFLELGYLVVVFTLVQIAVVALVLIILPLFKIGFRNGGRWWVVLYFGGIGLGYMFLEMVFIQQFILFFGNPIHATAAVITGLLVSSGAGSYFSERLSFQPKKLMTVPLLIAGLVVVFAFALSPILQATIGLPMAVKILLLAGLIFPLGFLMGIPFPAGLSMVAKHQQKATPWAWAVNGFFSVISTALATIVAVEMGFSWALLLAAAGYAVTAGAVRLARF